MAKSVCAPGGPDVTPSNCLMGWEGPAQRVLETVRGARYEEVLAGRFLT